MDIALCFTHSIAQYASVLIQSIVWTNGQHNLSFHFVCDDDVTAEDKKYLQRAYKRNPSKNVGKISFAFYTYLGPSYPLPMTHFTKASFYRLYLPNILPENVSKVLYLDVDMIVVDDLSTLFDYDIINAPFAACIDLNECSPAFFNRVKIPTVAWNQLDHVVSYVNSGMMLINLEYFRSCGIHTIDAFFCDRNCDGIILEYPDQDLINHLFYNEVKIVSSKFNLMTSFLLKSNWQNNDIRDIYYDMINEAIDHPAIIHFAGVYKPWHKEDKCPYSAIWCTFAKMVENKNWMSHKRMTKLDHIKRIAKNLLCILKIKAPDPMFQYSDRAKRLANHLVDILFVD